MTENPCKRLEEERDKVSEEYLDTFRKEGRIDAKSPYQGEIADRDAVDDEREEAMQRFYEASKRLARCYKRNDVPEEARAPGPP